MGGDIIIIFSNIALNSTKIDYNFWETCNGDYVTISKVGEPYIERCIDVLERYMVEYPKHINYLVWKQYRKRFEKEIEQRSMDQITLKHNMEQPEKIMIGA